MKGELKVWHIVSSILIFALTVVVAQWFSDNYSFDGLTLSKNDGTPDTPPVQTIQLLPPTHSDELNAELN